MYRPKRVHGVGPVPCSWMFVGEGPGWNEDKAGVPFVGKTGDELDRFLDGDRLPCRNDVFLTNIYREYHGKDYVYTSDDLARDEQDLWGELRRVQPAVIIPLGRHATRYFLGDVDMDDTQGIPWYLPANSKLGMLGDGTVVFPITHPAAGFHNPEMAAYVVSGMSQLAAYLNGTTTPRTLFDDPYPNPTYEEITSVQRLDAVLALRPRIAPLAIDTEGWTSRPWSLQFSYTAGSGYLIRSTETLVLRALAFYLRAGVDNRLGQLLYHSALHDIAMMRAMGLPTDLPFDDTMVMAYLLQLEPQGLKALCVRHCGMVMQSYDDVLGDASQRLALDYVNGLWDLEQLEWEDRRETAFWQELDKGRRISTRPKVPKSPLHKACERLLRAKDARKLWTNQVEDIQVAGYYRLGSMPVPTLDHVPAPVAVSYGSRDADGTGRVLPVLSQRIDALGLRSVYQLELGTYPLIERMSHVGLKPDLEHFARLSIMLGVELARLQTLLEAQSGQRSMNANSGDQVAAYLFDSLQLDSIKDTRSGRGSTNDKILEALEHEHPEYPVISTIRSYRETYKLKHTFVDRLPDFVHRWPHDGRVHATFRTTRVVTGRLAASDPNLLAMPKHGQFANDFRAGWVPEFGHLLCEWDLSQIELRVLAHLSQDPCLLAAFRDGLDLHARLAQRIFGGVEADHKKGTTRLAAKAVNFGIPMGMTNKGLSVELRKNGVDADEDDAQRWLDDTMSLYRRVPVYQEEKAAEARRQGYVRCLSGRIRYIGGIRSPHTQVREEARRFAFSTPIQEGAQWVMKLTERRLYEDILVPYWKDSRWVEPLIQIHDALTLECEDDPTLAQDLNRQMVANMTQLPPGFTVPIETSGDCGYNWAVMEGFPDA